MKKKLLIVMIIPLLILSCEWIPQFKDLFSNNTTVKKQLGEMSELSDDFIIVSNDMEISESAALTFIYADAIAEAFSQYGLMLSDLFTSRSIDAAATVSIGIADEKVALKDNKGEFIINDFRLKTNLGLGIGNTSIDKDFKSISVKEAGAKIEFSLIVDAVFKNLDLKAEESARMRYDTKIKDGFVKGDIKLAIEVKDGIFDYAAFAKAFDAFLGEDFDENDDVNLEEVDFFQFLENLLEDAIDCKLGFSWGAMLQLGGSIQYLDDGKWYGGKMLNQVNLKALEVPTIVKPAELLQMVFDKDGNLVFEDEEFYKGYDDEDDAIADFVFNKIIGEQIYRKKNLEWFSNKIRVYDNDGKEAYKEDFSNKNFMDMVNYYMTLLEDGYFDNP